MSVNVIIGLIGLAVMIAFMFLRIPLGVVFALCGGIGTLIFTNFDAVASNFGAIPYIWATQYTFSCLPMFVLLGMVIATADVAKDLYTAAYRWFGRLPGGLAMTTLIVTAIFSAISGSAIAAVSTIGIVCYPEMKRYGYDKGLSSGVIAAGATMDIMIPPSVPMLIYVMLSDVSVGKMFLAGFGPGLVEVILFSLFIFIIVKRKPSMAPLSDEKFTFVEKIKGLKGVVPFLIIFAIVFGGLYGGIFTPTEAGAAGAMSSILVCLAMRRLKWKQIKNSLIQTTRLTGQVITILIGVMLFNTFIALSGMGAALAQWITSSGMSATMFLIFVIVLYVPLGALMDEMSMMLLTVPLYMPVVAALGIDPIHFGILIILSWQIGNIAPPVGLIVFVAKSVLKEIDINTIYKGALPFLFALIMIEFLVLFFPEIALYPLQWIK